MVARENVLTSAAVIVRINATSQTIVVKDHRAGQGTINSFAKLCPRTACKNRVAINSA